MSDWQTLNQGTHTHYKVLDHGHLVMLNGEEKSSQPLKSTKQHQISMISITASNQSQNVTLMKKNFQQPRIANQTP